MGNEIDYRETVDIIIPTYNNEEQLFQCVQSMMLFAPVYPINIIIVNNGDQPIDLFNGIDYVKVIDTGKNLGWTGGLREGLKQSESKYVMFANDDIYIPRSSIYWLKKMMKTIRMYPSVGAVGPSSNVVMGLQNIWSQHSFSSSFTSYLVGFCILLKREALEKAGGIHDMRFGGDDLDLSIRLRKAEYDLVVNKDVFVYHHGFQTGEKVHGTPDKPGGWNSREMIENTNIELIKKHGFIEYHNTVLNHIANSNLHNSSSDRVALTDAEGTVVQKFVNGGKVIELGCGARKTVETAIGVDIIPKGDLIPYMNDQYSVADVTADVSHRLPFEDKFAGTVIARHVLEHCLDVPKTLKEWSRVIQDKGRLIIACPNENVVEGIELHSQHLHAFTADSIASYGKLIGLKEIGRDEYMNGTSFVIALEKEIA
jgi:GT2 family glycosyltransferase/SAM-dependent methyltransferase